MLALDIRKLRQRGLLKPGITYGWHWSRDDDPAGNVSIQTAGNGIRLLYSWTPYDDAPRQFDYFVEIHQTSCFFGGWRPWFRCPRCNRRCAVLYGIATSDGKFGCRTCLRLAYSSEAEDFVSRLYRRQRKLEARLIGDEGMKPPRMHQRTFQRICSRLDAVDEAIDTHSFARVCQMLERSGENLEDLFGDV